MVYYFRSRTDLGVEYLLYMGKDKMENEELIKYGWPEDLWFHADKLSSAHVYIRMPRGTTIDALPQSVIDDCAQLTKENSIQGKKLKYIKVVYTPWSNLHKTNDMEAGAVGFHKPDRRWFVKVSRDTKILNRLKKTKVEKMEVNFEMERMERDKLEAAEKREFNRNKEQEERKIQEERLMERERRSYDKMFNEEDMVSNANMNTSVQDYEDNFM